MSIPCSYSCTNKRNTFIVLWFLWLEIAAAFSNLRRPWHSGVGVRQPPPHYYSHDDGQHLNLKHRTRHSATTSTTSLFTALTLYGSQGSRSPLVNWAAYELGIDLTMGNLAENPHPFGQLPCLLDNTHDEEVVVFESGAILLYLNSRIAATNIKRKHQMQGEIYSWVCWANASLDPVCFLETPDGKVYDTGLKNIHNKRIRRLELILADRKFLVDDGHTFTVADVAVASYLLYVVQFFPDIDLSHWPQMVQYMKECASRPAYGKAFGEPVQAFVLDRLNNMGPKKKKKKTLGMF